MCVYLKTRYSSALRPCWARFVGDQGSDRCRLSSRGSLGQAKNDLGWQFFADRDPALDVLVLSHTCRNASWVSPDAGGGYLEVDAVRRPLLARQWW